MSDLKIAVLGVGMMGADHVARITARISGARVVVVNDYLRQSIAARDLHGARAVVAKLFEFLKTKYEWQPDGYALRNDVRAAAAARAVDGVSTP